MRFRTKTIIGVAVIEIALLAVLVGSALQALRDSNELELTRRVQLGGKLIAAAAKEAVISQDLGTLDSLVIEAMASNQIAYVRILDASGMVLAKRGDAAALARTFHLDTAIDQVDDGIFDWSGQVMTGEQRYGEVQLGVSIAPLKVLLDSARRWAASIAGLEIVLVALFSWLLGSYLVRQLTELRAASQRLAKGDFAQRVPVRGDDELAETAMAFNSMAQQLSDGRDQLNAENLARLKAQQHVDERNEQLNAIFNLSPDGFVSFDAQRRVKYVSPAFTKLIGESDEQIKGLSEDDFSAWLIQRCKSTTSFLGIAALRAQVAAGKPDLREVIEVASPQKRVLEVGLRCSASDQVSQILYLHDVTHETEVSQMKSEFLSTAAHELRTPMASILGFAEVLLNDQYDAPTQHEFLSTIFRQSRLMADILNELLDLARIEARRDKDFTYTRVDLQDLIADLVKGYPLPSGRAAPVLDLPAQPLYVMADIGKLRQALINIVSNAYKYSPDSGPVQIKAWSHHEEGQEAQVCIEITDHGIGMTPTQLARVCERFYRADASGKIPGTGLGMSIVKEIIGLHHGQLSLDSTPGQGTHVRIFLPAYFTLKDSVDSTGGAMPARRSSDTRTMDLS